MNYMIKEKFFNMLIKLSTFDSFFHCYRSEFGLLLAYFYLCDRTDFFGSSKKVNT